MTRPRHYLFRMVLFLCAVAAALAVLFPGLQAAFLTNAPLNGLIAGVFLFGVLYNLRQVLRLEREVAWIAHYRSEPAAAIAETPPRLLAPMAAMLGNRTGRLTLSAPTTRSLLDGIASRLDQSRELSRYTIGLLIFLGLLGTFWGLSQTVGAVGEVIRGLSVGGGDVTGGFETLKRGLAAPLGGMGTAFSSSLFGLAGSLILGFLDLQAGQAQNRFYNELEDWLAGLTRLPGGSAVGDAEHAVPVYVQALLEQTAESLERLQHALMRGEENRAATGQHLLLLGEKLGALTDHLRTEQQLMLRLAEGQAELKPVLQKLAQGLALPAVVNLDETTRTHIRNLDLYVARLIEETISGRDELVRQIRNDIKLLARTIATLGDAGERSGSGY